MKKNQGFSLVELIVVIAIMAVLVGVLAPAYLKYVEKSRKSSDISSISDILFAADKVAVDVQFQVPAGAKFILNVATNGEVTLSAVDKEGKDLTDVTKEWVSIAGQSNGTKATVVYTCKSSQFSGATAATVITGTVSADGSVAYTYATETDLIKYSNDFKSKMSPAGK